MRIENFSVRVKDEFRCVVSWTSESEEMISWVFVNGKFIIGPFMPFTLERSLTIPFSRTQTAIIEIHEFDDSEMIPNSCEEMPQTKPELEWTCVAEAMTYRVYHGDFETGVESLVSEVPAQEGVERMKINSPVLLDGKNGKWYWFRIESLDKYGHESANNGQLIPYFASDLPPVPQLAITKQSNNLYSFTINP